MQRKESPMNKELNTGSKPIVGDNTYWTNYNSSLSSSSSSSSTTSSSSLGALAARMAALRSSDNVVLYRVPKPIHISLHHHIIEI